MRKGILFLLTFLSSVSLACQNMAEQATLELETYNTERLSEVTAL